MSSKHKTLQDLFQHQVKDLYYAERHAGKMLLKMAKVASSDGLKLALDQRHDETAANVDRLEAIFDSIDKKAHGVPCEAMQGIIEETKTLLDDFDGSPALDAGLIAAAQAMEHYAIARYTALQQWGGQLGLSAARAPVEASLADARRALERWTTLAGTVPVESAAAAAEPMTVKEAALMGLR